MNQVFYTSGSCSAGEPRAPAWPSPPRLHIIVPKVDKWPRVLTVTRAARVQAFLHQEYTGPHKHTHTHRAHPGGPCPFLICFLCTLALYLHPHRPMQITSLHCEFSPLILPAIQQVGSPLVLRAQRWQPAGEGARHIFPRITCVVP